MPTAPEGSSVPTDEAVHACRVGVEASRYRSSSIPGASSSSTASRSGPESLASSALRVRANRKIVLVKAPGHVDCLFVVDRTTPRRSKCSWSQPSRPPPSVRVPLPTRLHLPSSIRLRRDRSPSTRHPSRGDKLPPVPY